MVISGLLSYQALNPVVGIKAIYYDLANYTGNSFAFNGARGVPTSLTGNATEWGVAAIIIAPTNLILVFGTGFGVFGKLELLLRPCEVLNSMPNPQILEIALNTLMGLHQHRPVNTEKP